MGNIKRKHSVDFKTKVALELIQGHETINSKPTSKRKETKTNPTEWL